jgi:hypothetical protein
MIVRMRLFWQFFGFLGTLSGILFLVEKYQQISVLEYIAMLLCEIMFAFGSIFVFPTERITLEKNGIRLYWKISIGFKVLYERLDAYIPYNLVIDVSSWLPSWFPIHIITVGGNGQLFIFGILFTKERETFAILANKINPSVMDRASQKILAKYKKKYKDRINL